MYLNNKIIIEIDSRVRAPTDESRTDMQTTKDAIQKELLECLGWETFDKQKEYFTLNINVLRNELTAE